MRHVPLHLLRYAARCAAYLLLCTGTALAAQATLRLTEAQFVLSDSTTPPADSAAWQAQKLPDNWNLSRPGVGGFGWYRLSFTLPQQPRQAWAIYARKLSMNAAFYVNGEFLGSGGSFTEPVARHWNRPLLFAVPPALLRAGHNSLQVRLWAYPNTRGGLDEIKLGPETLLLPQYEQRHFIQTILPQLCNIVVAAMGLFAFALWVRRRETIHVLFCAFTMLWAARSVHMFARDIPIPAFYWDIWVQSSFGWCTILYIALAMRMSNLRWPRFESLMIAYAISGPILMYLAGPQQMHRVANNWAFLMAPVTVFFVVLLTREAWRQRTLVSAVFAAVWALVIAASVHDGLVHRNKLSFDSFYFVSYAMIFVALVIGWILIKRFVEALRVAQQLNFELEQRVAQKHAELERNFRRLQEAERRTAVAEERRRLMSEMHDGIGSQLIATLDAIEHGDAPRPLIANELRECLDHLRLTIDSLEPTDNDLLSVLGNLRYRLEGRLKRQGIALSWQVRDVPRLATLTPQNVLHVLRILQEVFTNIIKHAGARNITLESGSAPGLIFIRVFDDGSGFRDAREGRGLSNMRRRARELGARLEITPSATGTCVTLQLPLAEPSPAGLHVLAA